MILLKSQELLLDKTASPIDRWETWFQTPAGLVEKCDEAVKHCMDHDFDPTVCIIPVSVAIDKLGRYEVHVRF